MENRKIYKRLAKSLAQLISLAKMYNCKHPIVKEKLKSVYKEINDFFADDKQSIVLAKSTDMVLINGEKIDTDNKLMARFVEDFSALGIGSMEFESGISMEELENFTHLLCRRENITGVDKIKQIFSDKKDAHIIARAATFKLVQENEDIVKKGEVIRVEELSPDALKKFSKDVMEGKVSEKLKTEGSDYKILAHNSTFLAGLTLDLIKEKDAPEDLEKTLWLLADYLIDEIGTFKEENMNRAVLEEIKKKLLSMLRDDPKKHIIENVKKTYAVINTAIQIKGLVSLYKRHKKELESSANKLKKILKNLPVDSRLYQKTIKDLIECGPISVNESTFSQ